MRPHYWKVIHNKINIINTPPPPPHQPICFDLLQYLLYWIIKVIKMLGCVTLCSHVRHNKPWRQVETFSGCQILKTQSLHSSNSIVLIPQVTLEQWKYYCVNFIALPSTNLKRFAVYRSFQAACLKLYRHA